MSETIEVAIISGAFSIVIALITLIGVIIQNRKTRKDNADRMNEMQNDLIASIKTEVQVSQAITANDIKHLTDEVHKHNNFAQRIPQAETEIQNIKEDIKEIKEDIRLLKVDKP